MRNMTHLYVWRDAYKMVRALRFHIVWRDSFIHMGDMTQI